MKNRGTLGVPFWPLLGVKKDLFWARFHHNRVRKITHTFPDVIDLRSTRPKRVRGKTWFYMTCFALRQDVKRASHMSFAHVTPWHVLSSYYVLDDMYVFNMVALRANLENVAACLHVSFLHECKKWHVAHALNFGVISWPQNFGRKLTNSKVTLFLTFWQKWKKWWRNERYAS